MSQTQESLEIFRKVLRSHIDEQTKLANNAHGTPDLRIPSLVLAAVAIAVAILLFYLYL